MSEIPEIDAIDQPLEEDNFENDDDVIEEESEEAAVSPDIAPADLPIADISVVVEKPQLKKILVSALVTLEEDGFPSSVLWVASPDQALHVVNQPAVRMTASVDANPLRELVDEVIAGFEAKLPEEEAWRQSQNNSKHKPNNSAKGKKPPQKTAPKTKAPAPKAQPEKPAPAQPVKPAIQQATLF